jgi:hypothetical protein
MPEVKPANAKGRVPILSRNITGCKKHRLFTLSGSTIMENLLGVGEADTMEEANWINHLDLLAGRLLTNDPALTHLEPYPKREEIGGPSRSPNTSSRIPTTSTLFHMMILLDDQAIQEALDRLWGACRTNENTCVRRVSLPAFWPSPCLSHALAACRHLQGLQELQIATEPGDDVDVEEETFQDTPQRVWHASPLWLATDMLPVLEASSERMRRSLPVAGLVHLQLASRLKCRTQADIDQLGQVLTSLTSLQTLSLRLVPDLAATAAHAAYSLDPVLQGAAQLSHPDDDVTMTVGL